MDAARVRRMVLCALFAALTAVCAQVVLPIGPAPVSLALLPVLLGAALLPGWSAVYAALAYVVMGLIGLPVFAGFTGGPGVLFGMTGGYIIGYVLCAGVAAKWMGPSPWRKAGAMAAGVAACYIAGTLWIMAVAHIGPGQAIVSCVLPYIPGDAAKIALAVLLSRRIEKALRHRT